MTRRRASTGGGGVSLATLVLATFAFGLFGLLGEFGPHPSHWAISKGRLEDAVLFGLFFVALAWIYERLTGLFSAS